MFNHAMLKKLSLCYCEWHFDQNIHIGIAQVADPFPKEENIMANQPPQQFKHL